MEQSRNDKNESARRFRETSNSKLSKFDFNTMSQMQERKWEQKYKHFFEDKVQEN